jgi:methylthioribose-1-phosphate isomerase
MQVNNQYYHTIWLKEDDTRVVQVIDQRYLPHQFVIEDLTSVEDVIRAIKDMHIRGAGLIGVTAAYGMYLATLTSPKDGFDGYINNVAQELQSTRPTAINLAWAVEKQLEAIGSSNNIEGKIQIALKTAEEIKIADIDNCKRIGYNGFKIIEQISKQKNGEVVNILTHCNAGWLAMVDYGTALAPIYEAHKQGIKIHIWVDETRPRNQGAKLTAWELLNQGIPHHIIADNVGGYLMQKGMVDLCIVGADRVTYTGDVANKIGTYLKALAAKENNVPFFVAFPSSTFDWNLKDGINEIPIEERDADEVKYIDGIVNGKIENMLITPKESPAINFGFDITPAKLLTGLITERGICKPNEQDIFNLFPERKKTYEEGYIKFICNWTKSEPLSNESIAEINKWRNKLYNLGLIGAYPNGIGFGNISIRQKNNEFIITGSATGNLKNLDNQHYVLVNNYNIQENMVDCIGPIKASSESLSHAIIYEMSPETNAIIHIHNLKLWEKFINKAPTTNSNISYGTTEMANEIKKMFQKTNLLNEKFIVMGGHIEGIIAFGKTLDEVGNIIINKFNLL